jgi:hypothetical protein
VVLLLAVFTVPTTRTNAQSPQIPVQDTLSQEDLEELFGPIALYPDTLLANVMAASCYPDEVAAAAAYVNGGGDPAKIADQAWEPPVQAVAKVPDALKVLAESPDWTAAIGQAYMVQSKDVMAAIQSLRAKAKASGALQNSQQQTVVEDGTTIIIEPAQPEVVYVPQYQPQVVYAPPPPGPSAGSVVATGLISFGAGMLVGAALDDNDCDWWGGGICHGGDVEIDVDRNVNIENVNVDRSRTNTVNQANVRNRSGTRAGSEGTAWKPNQQKVAAQSTAKSDQLSKFKGAGSGAASGAKIPGRGGGTAARSTPAAGANRDAAQARSGGGTPRPSAQRESKPSPAAKSSPDRKPSAFSPDSGSKAARDRGAASRASAGSHGGAKAGGGSRGGGGARGGGGGRGGGRGR